MHRGNYVTFIPIALAWILCAGTLVSAASGDASAPAPLSAENIATLRIAALGDDREESIAALRQLAGQGAASRATQALGEVVPQLLSRDAATIESESAAVTPQLPRLRLAEGEIDPLRAQAIDAIDHLTTEPASLAIARRNYARLSNTAAKATPIYARQLHIIAALARRALCTELVPPAKAANDAERLARLAAAALAMPPDEAQKFLTGPLDPPASAAQGRLWFFIASRRIEAWNRQQEPAMNAAEIAHARRVNAYREVLGLLPYEWDARLIQSARRHSKEMIELWYFGHYSPTESERSPYSRMARAGYAAGSNENITMGSWTPDDAFWQFFNSPEHHRAWLDRDATAIGVGKWEFAWTQDIGTGPRLMTAPPIAAPLTASPADREKGTVLGEELKPQAKELTRQHPRDLATIKFYDESGQEVKMLPGIERRTAVKEGP